MKGGSITKLHQSKSNVQLRNSNHFNEFNKYNNNDKNEKYNNDTTLSNISNKSIDTSNILNIKKVDKEIEKDKTLWSFSKQRPSTSLSKKKINNNNRPNTAMFINTDLPNDNSSLPNLPDITNTKFSIEPDKKLVSIDELKNIFTTSKFQNNRNLDLIGKYKDKTYILQDDELKSPVKKENVIVGTSTFNFSDLNFINNSKIPLASSPTIDYTSESYKKVSLQKANSTMHLIDLDGPNLRASLTHSGSVPTISKKNFRPTSAIVKSKPLFTAPNEPSFIRKPRPQSSKPDRTIRPSSALLSNKKKDTVLDIINKYHIMSIDEIERKSEFKAFRSESLEIEVLLTEALKKLNLEEFSFLNVRDVRKKLYDAAFYQAVDNAPGYSNILNFVKKEFDKNWDANNKVASNENNKTIKSSNDHIEKEYIMLKEKYQDAINTVEEASNEIMLLQQENDELFKNLDKKTIQIQLLEKQVKMPEWEPTGNAQVDQKAWIEGLYNKNRDLEQQLLEMQTQVEDARKREMQASVALRQLSKSAKLQGIDIYEQNMPNFIQPDMEYPSYRMSESKSKGMPQNREDAIAALAVPDSEDEDFFESSVDNFRRPLIVPPLLLGQLDAIEETDDEEDQPQYQQYSPNASSQQYSQNAASQQYSAGYSKQYSETRKQYSAGSKIHSEGSKQYSDGSQQNSAGSKHFSQSNSQKPYSQNNSLINSSKSQYSVNSSKLSR